MATHHLLSVMRIDSNCRLLADRRIHSTALISRDLCQGAARSVARFYRGALKTTRTVRQCR